MLKAILAEGEKLDTVEVVAIDIDKSEVTIKNGSVVTPMSAMTPLSSAVDSHSPIPPLSPTRSPYSSGANSSTPYHRLFG